MKLKTAAAAALGLLVCAGAYCGYRYYRDDVLPEKQLDDAYTEQQELIGRIRPSGQAQNGSDDTEGPLALCEAVNDDTVGWIYIPDTNIDLPVVQGKDNDLYLHNGVNGQYNYDLGCPFLDCRCESGFTGFNSIVYGHHITGRRMFADISLFADEAFMQQHPEGTLTLEDGVHKVRFFAYLNVYSTAPVYHAVFMTAQEKKEYVDYLFSEANHTQTLRAEDIDENSRLLLLSTCTYEFEDARGVLAGVIE